jgi:tryptophan synthase alpha chain
MATRISTRFNELAEQGRKGFVAYICAGDPNLDETVDLVLSLEDAGADFVELGIPFSDPLADGPTNQEAAARALAAGVTVPGVFGCVEAIRKRSAMPLLFMTYLNPLHAYGLAKVTRDAAAAGADGFLLLDLPAEESEEFVGYLKRDRLDNICLVAPTSTDERIARIVEPGSGFVYCVSREGVTGKMDGVTSASTDLVRRTRRHTSLPVALGFGISTPAQARAAARGADAIVVGSAIVKAYHEAPSSRAGRRRVAKWVRSLVEAAQAG